jgi:streptogramin lyase
MGQGIQRWQLLLAAMAAVLVTVPAAPASAAAPTLYQLPDATHAGGMAVAPDGALWFAGSHGTEHPGNVDDFVGRWDPVGGLAEFSLPPGRWIGKPVVTARGEVWLPGSESNRRGYSVARIGSLSSSGLLSDYPLGNRVGGVESVATLAGAVWFAASRSIDGRSRATIGWIAAAGDGAVHQVPLPSRCWSHEIAAAATAIWFTESCWRHYNTRKGHRASVGRIDWSGKITRYRVSPRFEPISLAVAADGSVWFGESPVRSFQSKIGRVTPAGRVVEFNVPDVGWPNSVAVGPEGRLWFPSTTGGSVTRALNSIGPAGDVGKPICLDPECKLQPSGLTAGADGGVWFSATTASSGGGGGGTRILIDHQIANEAGYIGRLSP